MSVSSHLFEREHSLKCEMAGEILCSTGILRLKVAGWSMLPALLPGDTLVIERATYDRLTEGDIVLFQRERRLFAHRVISQSSQGNPEILTRGDSMPRPDPPVAEHEVLGRVAYVIRNGRCTRPSRALRFPQRAVAALARHSGVARVIAGVHGMRPAPQN